MSILLENGFIPAPSSKRRPPLFRSSSCDVREGSPISRQSFPTLSPHFHSSWPRMPLGYIPKVAHTLNPMPKVKRRNLCCDIAIHTRLPTASNCCPTLIWRTIHELCIRELCFNTAFRV